MVYYRYDFEKKLRGNSVTSVRKWKINYTENNN